MTRFPKIGEELYWVLGGTRQRVIVLDVTADGLWIIVEHEGTHRTVHPTELEEIEPMI